MDLIYLDNAATTRMEPEVLEAMLPYLKDQYGNPSAIYSLAAKSRSAVDLARRQAAALIHADPSEIFFTSGGSEADNWALEAAAEACAKRGSHIVTTKVEHHAVLNTCRYLEERGVKVTYLNVDENGLVDPADVEAAITDQTVLVSVMTANNEIGTIEPIAEIGSICRKHRVFFHTDAVQAFGHIPIDVKEMKIDLLSASAHKLGGPKGVGLLYIKKGLKIRSFIRGGAQERGRRAGTENVPGIVGFGRACKIAAGTLEERARYERKLRDLAIGRLEGEISGVTLSGDRTRRLPNNIHVCIKGAEGQVMLILLDQRGICASGGSACTSGSLDPSHVLTAIGVPEDLATCSIRLTLSHENTETDINQAVDAIKEIVLQLREN